MTRARGRTSFVSISIAIALSSFAAPQHTAGAAEPPAFQRGVCYAHTWGGGGDNGYGSMTSARSLERLRGVGVNWISLTPFGFMESLDATEIRLARWGASETDERIAAETRRAHALGLKVALKPHIWIRRGEWQGELRFGDAMSFRRWFASYREMMLHFARLAADTKTDLLVVGTELKSATARDPAAFRALVAELRKIYGGPMTYAANWDEADNVAFWDALDFIGVNAYMPVTQKRGATLDELRAGWKRIADDLGKLSKRAGRPVLLTEIGYRATRDAATSPATWPEGDKNASYDPAHQADCYRAALDTLWGQKWLAGIYIWKWFTDSKDESGPTDFSPAGKPAESVLREFYTRRR